MTLKERLKKRPFSYGFAIISVIMALFMVSMMLPGDNMPGGTKVSATFTTPLYSDCYIADIWVYDDDSPQNLLVNWDSSNPSSTPNIALNTVVDDIYVEVRVNASRLAGAPTTGATVHPNLNITLIITTPGGVSTTLYGGTPGYAPTDISKYTYTFNDLNYALSVEGYYTVQVVYKIKVP